MEFLCDSVEQLPQIAEQIINATGNARVFAFYGTMGAGKTTLIRELCKVLNTSENANSPSFAIINEYTIQNSTSVYHFDFYRIKNESEAFDLGYEDYFYSGNYCFIEWPEKIESLLPPDHVTISIEDLGGQRKISCKFKNGE